MRASEFVAEELVRAYHGNQGGIDTDRLHAPMWFTTYRDDAEQYAGDDGYVVVADLDISNPYVITPDEEPNTVVRGWRDLQAQGYDGIYDGYGDWIPFSSQQIRVVSKDDVVKENFADGHTPADAVLDYVKRKHHDFRMDREILMYPRWQLTKIPLGNLIIADYTDSDIDLDQVDVVKRDLERKINQSPIIVDPAGAIIDGNHRAFAARELGMTHIPAWRPVDDLDENFADGRVKGKSRPGRVKRAGASCKGSVTDLRARARKYSGERGKMYHWCANMKGGKQGAAK